MRTFAAVVVLAGCTSSNLPPGNSDLAGVDLAARDLARGGAKQPAQHRTDDSACATTPPAGDCTLTNGFGACSQDSDCTSGTHGRCTESTGGALTCFCTYDGCGGDKDCASGQVCACHGSPYTAGAGNTCMPGNCRTDADCPGSWCSPSAATNSCGGLGGYYCHIAGDQCTDDSDCPTSNGPQYCAWSPMNNRWQCAPELLCP